MINKIKHDRHFRKVIIAMVLGVIFSIILWSFDTCIKWQWLSNHSNRLVIYIAFQVAIILIAIRFSVSESGKIKGYVDFIVVIVAIIIPLLISNGKDVTVEAVNNNVKDTVPAVATTSPKKKCPAKPKTFKDNRQVLLSGIVQDAETGESLDSVIISINNMQACFSDRWGKFDTKKVLEEFVVITVVLYQKTGYKDASVSYNTPVKDADINLDGQKIKLNKK